MPPRKFIDRKGWSDSFGVTVLIVGLFNISCPTHIAGFVIAVIVLSIDRMIWRGGSPTYA
jgi:hypothetical protein